MTNLDLTDVKKLIGYGFDYDRDEFDALLRQAFVRKSYSKEHGGPDNEVLEFIGDKALDIAVVKKLADYYGGFNENFEFITQKGINEGTLTEIKQKLVDGEMLSKRIDKLGLQKYLIMGKGDVNRNVQDEQSVKEDLFEAIIGAVALDSDFNLDIITDVVENMLDIEYYLENGFDDDKNFVDLVQQWSQKKYKFIPEYEFEQDDLDGEFVCYLYLAGFEKPFEGVGYSKSEARMNAAIIAYEYLEGSGMLCGLEDEVGTPNEDSAINQLQELAQKGYCEFPEYEFTETHDESGNPIWSCACYVEDKKCGYRVESSSKKDAKRKAAYLTLCEMMGYTD